VRNILILLVFLLATVSLANADTCSSALKKTISKDGKINDRALKEILDFNGHPSCMVELIAVSPQYRNSHQGQITAALTTLKQSGSSVGTGGTTNIVSKGLTANVLSVATEYGALTESTNNQTVTISGTLAGVPIAFINQFPKLLQDCTANILFTPCIGHKWINRMSRVSYGVSYDTSQSSQTLTGTATGQSQGTTQPVTFTANTRQITQVTGKVILFQGNPATATVFGSKVKTDTAGGAVPTSSNALDKNVKPFTDWQANHSEFQTWQDTAASWLESQRASDLVTNWQTLGCSLVNLLGGPTSNCTTLKDIKPADNKQPDLFANADAVASSYANWVSTQYSFAEALRAKPVLTFEYNENRPVSQPANSVFRLAYGQTIRNWTLTFNGAASIYDAVPAGSIPGASRIRDVQVGVEADYDLTKLKILGSGTSADFTYYYQDQTSPAILNVTPGSPVTGITLTGLPASATQVFAQKGMINIAQIKLAIGVAQSSVRFPISVSWSNRTELIAKPAWRAQIGISYDLDSLFSGK
jgi:hypothetical protein